jgi:hypothetical protein
MAFKGQGQCVIPQATLSGKMKGIDYRTYLEDNLNGRCKNTIMGLPYFGTFVFG